MDDKLMPALQKISEALNGLDEKDRGDAVQFINLRYGAGTVRASPLQPQAGSVTSGPIADAGQPPSGLPAASQDFPSFPDLYHAAQPETHAEKALVGGYWLQKHEDEESFSSQAVNQHLKGMGYPVGNITRAFDWLMAQKPQLVQQMKKTGSTKQARKLFKLTHAGLKRVEEMIANGNTAE